MITHFKHKGLEDFFYSGSKKGINPNHTSRIRQILLVLHSVNNINCLNIPAFDLHQLRGSYEGFWAMKLSANYRIIFQFNADKNEVYDVNYIDYH